MACGVRGLAMGNMSGRNDRCLKMEREAGSDEMANAIESSEHRLNPQRLPATTTA